MIDAIKRRGKISDHIRTDICNPVFVAKYIGDGRETCLLRYNKYPSMEWLFILMCCVRFHINTITRSLIVSTNSSNTK